MSVLGPSSPISIESPRDFLSRAESTRVLIQEQKANMAAVNSFPSSFLPTLSSAAGRRHQTCEGQVPKSRIAWLAVFVLLSCSVLLVAGAGSRRGSFSEEQDPSPLRGAEGVDSRVSGTVNPLDSDYDDDDDDEYSPSAIYGAVLRAEPERRYQNLVLSPFSIWHMFRTLEFGADGQTLAEMRRFHNEEEEVFDPPALVAPAVFLFAERLYVSADKRDRQLAVYREHMRGAGGDVRLFDFPSRRAAVQEMNQFVQDQTDGLIDEIITEDELPTQPDVTAVNAAILKAQWEDAFGESYQDAFHGLSPAGERVDQRAMFIADTFDAVKVHYTVFGDAKVVRVPFTDTRLGMYFVLPEDYVDFVADPLRMTYRLDHIIYAAMFKNEDDEFSGREVMVKIPRFTIKPDSCKVDVLGAMRELGIKHLSKDADFSRMSDRGEQLGLNIWTHKAGIDTDENGVIASAASVGSVAVMSGSEGPPLEFIGDRPFIFAIVFSPKYGDPENDGSRDMLLFSGHVVDAEGAQIQD